MGTYGPVDYAKLRELLRKPSRYLPKDQSTSVSFPSGTPSGTEGYAEVSPPSGYIFAIRYFKLSTDPETNGNILVTGLDGVEVQLLATDQAENLADQLYDASDWDSDFIFCKKFRLYGKTTTTTTADRTVTLKWCGGLVKEE